MSVKQMVEQQEVVMRFVALPTQRQMHIFTRLNLIGDMPTKGMREGKAAPSTIADYVNAQIEKRPSLAKQLAGEIDRVTGVAR